MWDWAPRLVNELAHCNEPGHHLISVLCNDCLMALMSMLSRLLLTTFVECRASTTLLVSIIASVGIGFNGNSKISSTSDRKNMACSMASCKLRVSGAIVERTIRLIFFYCQVSGQQLRWLSTRNIICAPALLTPSLRFAWTASENAMIVQLCGSLLKMGNNILVFVCFNFRMLFNALIKSLTEAFLNLMLRSISSKAKSGCVPRTAQLSWPKTRRYLVGSDDVKESSFWPIRVDAKIGVSSELI